ncbi:MAG: M23 family metallopeptidase [Oceanococcaceae bacterium]
MTALRNWAPAAGVAVAAITAVVAAFALGRYTAPAHQTVVALGLGEVNEIRALLEREQSRIELAHAQTALGQAELARELGRMQAGLDRLEALGETLADMALLEPTLFDFTVEPPLGGPIPSEDVIGDMAPQLADIATQLELRRRQLDILEHMLLVTQLDKQASPSGWPIVKGWISSRFGLRRDPFTGAKASHYGLDFAAAEGSDVLAVAAGVVSYAGKRSGYGHVVEINHGNGYVTRYAHNQRNLVSVGDRVENGQVIAHVGHSGRATGAHLHFEVIMDGKRIDPARFVAKGPRRIDNR